MSRLPDLGERAAARLDRAAPLLVAALAFAAFWPALDAGFVNWDDPTLFLDNPHFRGLGLAQLRWMLTTTLTAHYTPLTWMSLGLNYLVGGMAPFGYHLGNLLLHAASVGVFYLVARRLLAAAFQTAAWRASSPAAIPIGAAVAALAFGLHPLRAESVVWVTERRGQLCAFFYLLALLAYLRAAADGGAVRGRWRIVSIAAFLAALLSKALAMTLPFTLLLLDGYPLRRRHLGWWTLLAEKTAYVGASIVAGGIALWAVARESPFTTYEAYGPAARLAMVAYALWFHPWKLVWPEGLSPLYELPLRVDPLAPRFLVPLGGLAAVTAGLLALRRRFPGGLAAWIHSAIVLAPVAGAVHAGNNLAYDRYSYLSGLGFAVVAGAAVTWALGRGRAGARRPWVATAVLAGALAALAGWGSVTWRQASIWRDSRSLWSAAVAADPSCARCQDNLGNALMEIGRAGEAEGAYRRAIALDPGLSRLHNNLGAALVAQGRLDEAVPEFQLAMRNGPRFVQATINLGAVRARQQRYADAIALYRQALRVAPEYPGLRANLAAVLRLRGLELETGGAGEEGAEELDAVRRRPQPASGGRRAR